MAGRFTLWKRVAMGAANAKRRLVDYFLDPKCAVLEAADNPSDEPQHVPNITARVKARKQCPQCFDIVTRHLLHLLETAPARALRLFFRVLLLAMEMPSSPVEKHHLLAQETRPQRRRGRALRVDTVAQHTYRLAAIRRGFRLAQDVKRSILKKHGITADCNV